ncbi:MAG: 2TM domain-containing protein, partial [Hyphomicrobiales bacterium]|nr:2TM domain-containing protein [Hyphomicrobiales bacterium]
WQVKGRLDLKVTDLGATQLKNIAEPIHVYSLEVGQQAQAEPVPWAAPAPPAPADQQAAIKRIRAKRGFARHATIYVAVNLLLIAIWALTGSGYANHRHGAESDFWPIWPILGWGVGLGVHYWTVFHQKPISEDEIRREMEKGS